jgi:hypothetical protein
VFVGVALAVTDAVKVPLEPETDPKYPFPLPSMIWVL